MSTTRSAADWAEEMARLRAVKPRPVSRTFGTNGPTAAQAEEWADRMRAWNRAYRHATKMQKEALAADNAAFYAARCAHA